jgi:hypothetical protein
LELLRIIVQRHLFDGARLFAVEACVHLAKRTAANARLGLDLLVRDLPCSLVKVGVARQALSP